MRSTSLLQSSAIGIVAGIIGTTIVWFIGDAVSGPLMANGPDGELTDVLAAAPGFATLIAGLVGVLVAFLIRNRGNAVQLFTIITVVVLVLYGIWAFSQAENFATGLWLNVMHIVAAVCITGMLTRWMQARQGVAV
ncbi:MAG: DUF6069 family protein [Actinomycetota bacterium]